MDLLQPKSVQIDGIDLIISKFPAIPGREIVAKYPLSGLPKLGDYAVNEETMVKLMSFVAIVLDGKEMRLSNKVLIDNQISSRVEYPWQTLGKIEIAMLEYNCSFFQKGLISSFFQDSAQSALAWISKTWTAFLERSSRTEKQP